MKANWALADAFLAAHPAEAARALEHAPAASSAVVLGRSSPSVIAGILQRMAPAEAAAALAHLPAGSTREVLRELSLGVAALILHSLAVPERDRLLETAPEETVRSLRTALVHPEGSAASMMDSNVLALPSDITAGEARRHARRRSRRAGNYLYLVDEQRRLVGAVGLGELALASPSARLATLTRSAIVRIPAQADVSMILAHEGWRELHAIPVVDSGGRLIGALRRETCERLREERAASGAHSGAGLGVALAELAWTAMVSAVDEMAGGLRPQALNRSEGGGDDE